MNKLEGNALIVLSAMFARSNMGHGIMNADTIAGLKKCGDRLTLSSAVSSICQDMIEDDATGDACDGEAKAWFKTLSKPKEVQSYRQSSPDIFQAYDEAEFGNESNALAEAVAGLLDDAKVRGANNIHEVRYSAERFRSTTANPTHVRLTLKNGRQYEITVKLDLLRLPEIDRPKPTPKR